MNENEGDVLYLPETVFQTNIHICPLKSIYYLVSEHTDQTLALLNFLLNLIAGGGDLSLSRQDSAQEAGQRSTYRRVERPAQRAQSGPEGRRLGSAVTVHLLWTPACGVQHEAHHEQQSWRKESTMRTEVWSRTCKHLEWENKQFSWNTVTQHRWKTHLFDKHLICEERNGLHLNCSLVSRIKRNMSHQREPKVKQSIFTTAHHSTFALM